MYCSSMWIDFSARLIRASTLLRYWPGWSGLPGWPGGNGSLPGSRSGVSIGVTVSERFGKVFFANEALVLAACARAAGAVVAGRGGGGLDWRARLAFASTIARVAGLAADACGSATWWAAA